MPGLRDNQATEAITAEIEADRLETFESWLERVECNTSDALDDLKVAERYVSNDDARAALRCARSALAEAAAHLRAAKGSEPSDG